MLKIYPQKWIFLAAGLVIFALAGCHAKPYDYKPTAGEMKEGPGVFSGEDGEFTIYDSKGDGLLQNEGQTPAAKPAAEQSDGTTAAAAAGSGTAAQSAPKPDKTRELQEFQEYRQWKKGAKNSADYNEFLEWKEFKSYQEWKKSQP